MYYQQSMALIPVFECALYFYKPSQLFFSYLAYVNILSALSDNWPSYTIDVLTIDCAESNSFKLRAPFAKKIAYRTV